MGTVDLDLLPTFLAVAETRSFSQAARRLRLPKSSVSRRVAALERALGVPLLHRTTRQVALTTAGAALRERVAPSLAALEASVAAVPEAEAAPSGHLRVTMAVDVGVEVLAPIVAQFSARYPRISVEVRLSNEVVDLVRDGVDVALRIALRGLRSSALVASRVAPIELKLYASPSYLAQRGHPSSPADVADHRWIGFLDQPTLRLTGPGRPIVVRGSEAVACDDMFFARALLRHGAGIGALPTFLAERDVLAGTLAAVLPRWATPSGALWLVRHGGPAPRKVQAFEAFVRSALAAARWGSPGPA